MSSQVKTRRIFDMERYSMEMNYAVHTSGIEMIDTTACDDDPESIVDFKRYADGIQHDVRQVRMAMWRAINREMNSFEISVAVDESIRNFIYKSAMALQFEAAFGTPGSEPAG